MNETVADEKKGRKGYNYVPGFGSLADFMSSDEDHSTAVYRRFDRLAARDLLYYQSELARLEALQNGYDIEDAKDALGPDPDRGLDVRSYARDWEKLRRAAEGTLPSSAGANAPSGGDVKARWAARMTLAREIRETLKAYREALLQESALLALRPPARPTMTALAGHFHHRDRGADGAFPMLSGPGARLYPWEATATSQQLARPDYVALSPHHGADPLTVFLTTHCARLFRLPPSPSPSPAGAGDAVIAHLPALRTARYPIRRVRVGASFITTLTAALLLFLPIYTLYHTAAARPAATLGLLALFTALLAVGVAVMTGARRAEVFGACAAYAAVLVVFVSGDFVGGGKGDG